MSFSTSRARLPGERWTPNRPHLALRVGIVDGGIQLQHEVRICEQITDVLRLVRGEVTCLSRMTETKEAYDTDSQRKVVPSFRFVSSLAEGAGRLAAHVAYTEGYALEVPMPFHREKYEWDFKQKESLVEFRTMLAWAGDNTVELDGVRDDPSKGRYDEALSYEAVGRFVARNCDVLIAVWDGRPGRGNGGSADIMKFAAEAGPPIWWIRGDRDSEPAWINDADDLRYPRREPGQAQAALQAYLEQLILPPKHVPQNGGTLVDRIAYIRRAPSEPLAAFFTETPPARRRWARTYSILIKLAARGYKPRSWLEPPPPNDRPAMFWHDAYDAPDRRAGEYAARYRSTYFWVLGFAALALICAAMNLAIPSLSESWRLLTEHAWHEVKLLVTATELTALFMTLYLVVIALRLEWQPRSTDYRLLAELYRKQETLASLGWSLSCRAVRALLSQVTYDEAPDRTAWVLWLFASMARAAPMLRGTFDTDRSERVRSMVRDLLDEQIEYHHARLTLCERANLSFVALGTLLTIAVIVVVLAKLTLLSTGYGEQFGPVLGLGAIVLPALAVTYPELDHVVYQSRQMLRTLRQAKRRVMSLDLQQPLASQYLAEEVHLIATRMLDNIDGWRRLFGVKWPEAG